MALQERETDVARRVGEQLAGAGPERGQDRAELVRRGDARVDEIAARAHDRAQRARLLAERTQHAQLVMPAAQVLRDHPRIAGIALGARADLGLPPRLDRGRLDGHHGMARLEQVVDEAAVRAFDRDRHLVGSTVTRQTVCQAGESLTAVANREAVGHTACVIDDADGVLLRRPIDPDEHRPSLVWQHEFGTEDVSRAVTDWRSTARPSVAGRSPRGPGAALSCWPFDGRPTQAVTPIPDRTTGRVDAPADRKVVQ
jgi:hypothetical protein